MGELQYLPTLVLLKYSPLAFEIIFIMRIDFSSFNKHVLNMTIIKVTLIMVLVVDSFPASLENWRLQITFVNSLDPDHARHFLRAWVGVGLKIASH